MGDFSFMFYFIMEGLCSLENYLVFLVLFFYMKYDRVELMIQLQVLLKKVWVRLIRQFLGRGEI